MIHIPKSVYDDYDGEQNVFGVFCKGYYGRGRTIQWEHCRENFQESSRNKKLILFRYKTGEGNRIKAFLARFLKDLNLRGSLRFRKTDTRGVLAISLGDFWRTEVHRSLLTALIRVGRDYTGSTNSYKSILQNGDYLRYTQNALKRFMRGYTSVSPTAFGMPDRWGYYETTRPMWRELFEGKTEQKVKTMLVKPKEQSNSNRKRDKVRSSSGTRVRA
jgi:hypothetical protein